MERGVGRAKRDPRVAVWLLGLALAVSLHSGCGRHQADKPPPDGSEEEAKAARSEIERGPVRATAEVEPPKARLSDELTLTLTIDSKKGVTIRKPPFGESLGDFLVRDFREPLPRVEGDREIIQQVYTLEPTRTGKLSIWPISVTFTDARPDGDGKEHTIETEGLTVEIASVVGSEAPSLGRLRPAAGPVELPETPAAAGKWWLLAVPVVLAAGAAAVWYRARRRRKTEQQEPLSAGELAYLELERLLEQGLAERDVKRFYVELTAIVRRYIERTMGILAPEQTTEEFLREISQKETFSPQERGRLKDFLESADLVKFAAYQPRRQDLEESFQRAKVFVGLGQMEVAA